MSGLFKIVIIAGPNGAGKTTFARKHYPEADGLFVYVNADEIARTRGLSSIGAGREMVRQIKELIEERSDVMIETTLASRSYASQIATWRSIGYSTTLYFLRLPDVEAAIARVAKRVAEGGHHIPEPDVRRRFERGARNFEGTYKYIVDSWVEIGSDYEVINSGRNTF